MGNSSTIFFRRSGDAARWSTSPADLVEDPDTDIDRAAIARCCRGEGPFIYPSIDRVRPGQVVILEQHRTTVIEYDRITPILTDNGAGYLSRSWDFPHPYSHTGYRYLEQAAERIAEDGVTFLTTGREGDILFGPAYYHYGMRDVLLGDVRWREKKEMLCGVRYEPREGRLRLHGPGVDHGSDPVPIARRLPVLAHGQQGLAPTVGALAQRIPMDSISRQAGSTSRCCG